MPTTVSLFAMLILKVVTLKCFSKLENKIIFRHHMNTCNLRSLSKLLDSDYQKHIDENHSERGQEVYNVDYDNVKAVLALLCSQIAL